MPLLQVRDFPESTYSMLTQAAEAENRSITQQTIHMLSQMLQDQSFKSKLKRNNALSALNGLNLSLPENTPSYISLIRQDRERDEGVKV